MEKKKAMNDNLLSWYTLGWAEMFHVKCALKSNLVLGNICQRLSSEISLNSGGKGWYQTRRFGIKEAKLTQERKELSI